MAMYDRKCKNCNHEGIDLIEKEYQEVRECPVCHKDEFIVLWRNSNFIMDGMDEMKNQARATMKAIEYNREVSAGQRGNSSYQV